MRGGEGGRSAATLSEAQPPIGGGFSRRRIARLGEVLRGPTADPT